MTPRASAPRVLVCFAVREEAAPFRPLAPAGVEVLVSGMGRAAAGAAIDAALQRSLPDLVLTCGFAGALDPALRRGAVRFEADPVVPAVVVAALQGAGARPGRIACADSVAVTAAQKRALALATGADLLEMESGVIREACARRGVPAVTIRVVSDEADEDLPLDFNALMTPAGSLHPGRLAWAIARSPWVIPGLLRLGRHTRAAAAGLAQVIAAGCRAV